jgi:hypothetical protein
VAVTEDDSEIDDEILGLGDPDLLVDGVSTGD